LAPASTLLFQTLSPSIFFFSSKRKLKKTKKKKLIEKKRNAEKGGSFLSNSHFILSILGPASTLPLLPFVSNIFSWHLFLFEHKKRKEKQRKKKP
jgi:hypothetical protein